MTNSVTKGRMNEIQTVSTVKERSNQKKNNTDICDLYGKLLAHKLKTLDEDDQLRLMNEIDNLAYKYRKLKHQCPSTSTST